MIRSDAFNAEILAQVEALHRERKGLGYDINSYFTRDLDYGPSGKIKANNPPRTMCVAAVAEVIAGAMTAWYAATGKKGPFTKLPIESWRRGTSKSIRAHIFMYDGLKSNGTAHALERFGIGRQLKFEELQPGDFINFNRENRSGHACVFLGYLDGAGRDVGSHGPTVAGFRYFSAQGKNSEDGGFGYRWAFFAGKGPSSLPGKRLDRGIIYSTRVSLLCCGYMLHPDKWPAVVGLDAAPSGNEPVAARGARRGSAPAAQIELPAPDLSRFDGATAGDTLEAAGARWGKRRAAAVATEAATLADYRDFVASLGIKVDLLPSRFPTRPGTRIRPQFITIHNTDNSSPGAGAAAHNRYVRGADAVRREVSWHFTVDDRETYQHLPTNEKGWHADKQANDTSIGIEICMNAGLDVAKAYARAADLIAHLILQLDLEDAEVLRQHFDWTGKNCPRVLRGKATGWRDFKRLVQQRVDFARTLSGAPGSPPVESVSEAAAFATRGRRRGNTARIEAQISHLETSAALDASFAEHAEAPTAVPQARSIPAGNPVPFSVSRAAIKHWPLVTRHPQAMEVNTLLVSGSSGTRPGRRFLADRAGGRYHVGIDLFCSENDPVVSIEDGKIVAFYPFYEGTNALLVAHDGYVVNYGEVAPNSLARLGLTVGSKVVSGQQIGTVGRLKMLHFESYGPGVKANQRWFKGNPRPSALRNSSQLLLDLATNGIRLSAASAAGTPVVESFSAMEAATTGVSAIGFPSITFTPGEIPVPEESGWHRWAPKRHEWRYDARGLSIRGADGTEISQRWDADLKTMRRIIELMGSEILSASRKHKINPALIMMTIATEAHVHMKRNFTGPSTFRWEAHVENKDVKPPVMGDYSPGPMQTLGTTVRWVIRDKGNAWDLAYEPFKVAPVYKRKPVPAPAKHPLYQYPANIDIGTAEIRIRTAKTKDDPILVAAAYNRGSLSNDSSNPWGLKVHGDHLDRAAKWYGDACAMLIEMGVF